MQIDIPGYKIVSTLGQGGMATVYLAIQTCFEREVALKVMSPHLCTDATFGERFLREARIVSRLMHPNIVTVYDVGIHEGLYYLSMEYLPGHDLKHKRFELNLAQSLNVVKDIARALDYAGRKGYVHRDVKPENIMLLDEDHRAVLMDFGIARPSDVASGMTQTGTAIGTPHYMSPEQAKGLSVDSRADLYSLGVVLFVLLAGHVPFDADSAVVVGIKHVSEAIPRLPDHLQVFQPIIDRVMAKDPEERYQTGSELIADLDSITSTQILAAMRAEDSVLDVPGSDELSPTMINPPPMLTGEQIVIHPNTALADAKPTIESYSEPVSTAPDADDLAAESLAQPHSSFSISEEERAEHHHYTEVEPAAQSSSWVGFVFLLLIIGGVFYFRSDLRLYWQGYAKPALGFESEAPTGDGAESSIALSSAATSPAIQEQPLVPAPQGNPTEPRMSSSVPDLLQQAQEMRAQLTSNPDLAADLAIIYRAAMVGTDPVQQAGGREGLEELQHFYAASIIGELDANDLDTARAYADAARSVFDEPERNLALLDALGRLAQRDSVVNRLQQAQQYLRDGELDEPAGANALDIYRAVLTEDPANSEARAGILAVAQRFGQLAQDEAQRGATTKALALLDKGLALAPSDAGLLQQQAQLREVQQERRAREQTLLRKAESQHMAGRVLQPSGDNAYETYREILDGDSSNQAALAGLASIEQTLVNNIQGLIERHRLLDAQSAIASARERFPRSQTLLALKVRAEQLLEQNQPAISHLIISNREITDIQQAQTETVAADRVIYIGFEYQNFKEGTSVLQAVLYDGARSLQLAQVPVIVSGSQGIQYFRIEQPVSGFSEGGYQVDLMLDNQTLKTTRFSIKK